MTNKMQILKSMAVKILLSWKHQITDQQNVIKLLLEKVTKVDGV